MIYFILFFVVYLSVIATMFLVYDIRNNRYNESEKKADEVLKKNNYKEESDPEKKANLIDEGVQNIMSYEVKI